MSAEPEGRELAILEIQSADIVGILKIIKLARLLRKK